MKKLSNKALGSLINKKIPNHVVCEKPTGKTLPLDEKEMNELAKELISNQIVGIYRILVQKHVNRKSIIESTFFEFVSDRFCELLDIEKKEFLRDAIASTLKRIHPDDLNEFIKSNEIAQQSLEPYSRETRLLIDNSIKWLRFESSP